MLLTPGDRSTTIARRVPTSSTLEAWIGRRWADGLQLDTLRDLDELRVHTRNSVYGITLVSAASGEVFVRGGRYFPEPTRALILGSSLGSALLKLRGIYCGFALEIHSRGTRIVTSPIQSLQVVEPSGDRPIQ